MIILIEVSNRHVHLARKEIDALFGESYKLKVKRRLSQPNQFAAEEKITLAHGGRKIENVRVLGPEVAETQVELAESDARFLGINPPRNGSGNLENSSGVELIGINGKIKISRGVIIPQRHLHASVGDADKLGLRNGQIVKISYGENIIDNVLVRVGSEFKLAVHLDKDEGEEFGIFREGFGKLIG